MKLTDLQNAIAKKKTRTSQEEVSEDVVEGKAKPNGVGHDDGRVTKKEAVGCPQKAVPAHGQKGRVWTPLDTLLHLHLCHRWPAP